MRLSVRAVGRLRAGPERALVDDYIARAGKAGRALGLGPVEETEVEDRKGGGPAGEAALLTRKLSPGALRVALDERGRALSSRELAAEIARWRDAGRSEAAFLIGGADGLDPALRRGADLALSLGPMVWPHALARVMLAEQLYRATQILAGTPYHRD
ncbi:23S rRNA (pseudouridine(1915)-N(3))-methyltransferase RlmH [Rhodosalinus sediminis]|uniref:23S rRNA (pseudouridine(1915)-N(3))-methyltransferase RlmH n=1 Tax=Rhodosalinus sediminis TaxID=1940533 RepID=UPI0023567C9C|nr:23S rRNA (pseudouridine(1915)-N(3))-methyltransferase RlmH [Rhodosalinus sediminis]